VYFYMLCHLSSVCTGRDYLNFYYRIVIECMYVGLDSIGFHSIRFD